MAMTDLYRRIPCGDIIVNREKRQRTVIDSKEIIDSIAALGVINPILVTQDLVLVAGERRLHASLQLNLKDIPVRFVREDLSEEQVQLIELEENVKRSNLDWRDLVRAIVRVHELLEQENEIWTGEQTAQFLNMPLNTYKRAMAVFPHLDHPNVLEQKTLYTASVVADRISNRITQQALNDIASTVHSKLGTLPKPNAVSASVTSIPSDDVAVPAAPLPALPAILNKPIPFIQADFNEWAKTYDGPRFNFLHCDFPYGVNLFSGKLLATQNKYEDTQEVYTQLIETLCENLDRLMTPNGHLMFWLSMEHYIKTIQLFRKLAPDLIFLRRPLVWLRSDNSGLVPATNRHPRQVYETALVATRGERFLAKIVSDGYAAPPDRALHASAKPEPMLKHFFKLFVDNTTSMLDPTCGAGSSIRAAEALGAERVLGIERDEESFNNAVGAYRKHLNIQALVEKENENAQTKTS